jgi:peptide/nickel transport system substrate-binding protein
MFKKPRFSPVVAALVLPAIMLFLLVSCSGKKAQTGQNELRELRYGFMSEPPSFDPVSSNTADGRSLLFNVFEGLVKPDTEGRLRPCIAESVTMEEEGRIYVFKLRENVRFHDGSPLTSADVQFTLHTAAENGFHGFSAIEKIETVGDYGIRVTLKNPDPEFIPFLTVGIVKTGSVNRERNATGLGPAGTGPFYIENYTPQQSLTLKKFENYWQEGVPKLDKVTVAFFENTDALVLGLQGGGLDGANLTGALAQQLDPNRFEVVPGYSAMVQLLALNNKAKPFDDIRIRQAVNFATNIQEVIDTAFYGFGEPSGSPLIPGLKAYYEQSLANTYLFDPDEAWMLLSEAGYGDGNKLSFEIAVPSIFTPHVDTAQVIAGRLGQIGIDVSIKLVEWSTWLSDVYSGRNYQATIISLDSPVFSPVGFLSRYRSDAGDNFINFSDAQFDQVYDAALTETNEAKRIELYKEAQRIISANAASVYIQDILGFKAFRAGFYGGVLNYPLYVVDFSQMYVKIENR